MRSTPFPIPPPIANNRGLFRFSYNFSAFTVVFIVGGKFHPTNPMKNSTARAAIVWFFAKLPLMLEKPFALGFVEF
jgi:hypothetical protein